MNLFGRKKIDDAHWLSLYERIRQLAAGGDLRQAAEEAQYLYDYSVKHGGKGEDRTINALNNLGYIHMLRDEYEKAEYFLLDALQESETAFGKYSNEVAILCMNLGQMYLARAKYVATQIEAGDGAGRDEPVA